MGISGGKISSTQPINATTQLGLVLFILPTVVPPIASGNQIHARQRPKYAKQPIKASLPLPLERSHQTLHSDEERTSQLNKDLIRQVRETWIRTLFNSQYILKYLTPYLLRNRFVLPFKTIRQ